MSREPDGFAGRMITWEEGRGNLAGSGIFLPGGELMITRRENFFTRRGTCNYTAGKLFYTERKTFSHGEENFFTPRGKFFYTARKIFLCRDGLHVLFVPAYAWCPSNHGAAQIGPIFKIGPI